MSFIKDIGVGCSQGGWVAWRGAVIVNVSSKPGMWGDW